MQISDVPFLKRFFARFRIGTRPSTPEGTGDTHWDAAGTTLSVSNAAGAGWLEYDLSDIGTSGISGGGTGFSSYTQGDLLVGNASTNLGKLGVSGVPDDYVLTKDSAQPLKVAWQPSAVGVGGGGTGQSTYAAGDLLVGNASNGLDKLGVGSAGNVLTINAGVPVWAAVGGSGFTQGCHLIRTSSFSLTSGTQTDVEWHEDYDTDTMFDAGVNDIDVVIQTTGKYRFFCAISTTRNPATTNGVELRLYKNGSILAYRNTSYMAGSFSTTINQVVIETVSNCVATDVFKISIQTIGSSLVLTTTALLGTTEFAVYRVG